MDAFDQEITTIFVIGFPEDMKEREFQNMFTFCQGFEAAILRYPDADAASKEGNTTNKIIGFAKFRTKIEALEARDVLTGRKVDPNSDGVLKAELAKKDLITKRGLFGNKAQSKNVSRSDLHSSFNLNARPLPTNYRLGGLATSAIRPSNLSIITNEGLGRLGGEQPLLSAPLLRSQDLYGDAFNHFDAYTTQTHDSLSSLGNMLNTDYDLGGQDGLSRSISDLKASSSLRLP
ncbi:RNA-binding protein with multiple splicing, partial [Zancudomyces culisetae]